MLQANKFSLMIDETTDLSAQSQLAILGVFFGMETFKMINVLVDLIKIPDGKSQTTTDHVIASNREKHILMENVIGFCADTCNVMYGAHHSVSKLLTENFLWITAVKSFYHSIHLCSSHACKVLPKSVEGLYRNIYSHFNASSKRMDALAEFQEYFETEKHRMLQASNKRRLSMKLSVDRIIQQYDALTDYFTLAVYEDPTHNNDLILKSLKNKFTLGYLDFMSHNLGRLASFKVDWHLAVPK